MSYEEEYEKLETLKKDKKIYRVKLRNQNKITHKEFVKKYKIWVRALDIMLIFCLILNFGAVFITNALVVKEKPTVEFHEANAIQANVNNYVEHSEGNALMRAILFQTLMWLVLITSYLSSRISFNNYAHLMIMTVVLIYLTFMITMDFVNDFGYLFGFLLWGA